VEAARRLVVGGHAWRRVDPGPLNPIFGKKRTKWAI
jgi:hypothetical protein